MGAIMGTCDAGMAMSSPPRLLLNVLDNATDDVATDACVNGSASMGSGTLADPLGRSCSAAVSWLCQWRSLWRDAAIPPVAAPTYGGGGRQVRDANGSQRRYGRRLLLMAVKQQRKHARRAAAVCRLVRHLQPPQAKRLDVGRRAAVPLPSADGGGGGGGVAACAAPVARAAPRGGGTYPSTTSVRPTPASACCTHSACAPREGLCCVGSVVEWETGGEAVAATAHYLRLGVPAWRATPGGGTPHCAAATCPQSCRVSHVGIKRVQCSAALLAGGRAQGCCDSAATYTRMYRHGNSTLAIPTAVTCECAAVACAIFAGGVACRGLLLSQL